MNKKNIRIIIIIIVIIAISIFIRTAIHATAYIPDSGSLETPFSSTSNIIVTNNIEASTTTIPHNRILTPIIIPLDTPVRLNIPSLNINAHIQRLGVTVRGSLGTPNNFVDVGWYAAGTVPGDIGSAIIDGHVDNGLGLSGVFKHLSDISPGSDIFITKQDGTTVHFIVTDVQSYDYENAPINMIFNENDNSLLRLITCGGTWVPVGRTYDKRIVVTALLAK